MSGTYQVQFQLRPGVTATYLVYAKDEAHATRAGRLELARARPAEGMTALLLSVELAPAEDPG